MAKLLDGYYKVENHFYKVFKVVHLTLFIPLWATEIEEKIFLNNCFIATPQSSIPNSRCQVRLVRQITVPEQNIQ